MSRIFPTGNRAHKHALIHLCKQLEDENTCSVSIMVSYITKDGVKLLEGALRKFAERHPGGIRVIASTHNNITEPAALETLYNLGAKVRVSYDVGQTRFHGKAWVFEKLDAHSMVHVGSSNWTPVGLAEGEELNVLVEDSKKDFLNYFNETWEKLTEATEFKDILSHERLSKMGDLILATQIPHNDILRPFQRKLLEQIQQHRAKQSSNSKRNLLVAATGTGKTVISAVDFKELRDAEKVRSMLFVAHRKEILEQAIDTFRFVLADKTFGQLQPDSPKAGGNEFVSVQWLAREENVKSLKTRGFDYIVIDEAHHGAASTYKSILKYFKPKYLLGMTATPERSDGRSILDLFGGVISAELRLWDAVSEGYLSPFKYFAVNDHTDLSNLSLYRGTYQQKDLEKIYLLNETWLATVFRTFMEQTRTISPRKVLGFCPTIEVSRRVAEYFTENGVPARHVDGKTKPELRDAALKSLKDGNVEAIFSVDLFNEGVDVPEINVVLLLRPTASPTVFIQQIGRGLRRKNDGSHCTIVDYVGNNNKEFDLGSKFGVLIPAARARLGEREEGENFEVNIKGCSITLSDDIAEMVIASLQRQISTESLAADLRYIRETNQGASLEDLISATGVTLTEFYEKTTFNDVQRCANQSDSGELMDDDRLIHSNLKMLVRNHKRGAPMFEPCRKFLQGKNVPCHEIGYVDALCRVLFGREPKKGLEAKRKERREALLRSPLASEVEKILGLLAT